VVQRIVFDNIPGMTGLISIDTDQLYGFSRDITTSSNELYYLNEDTGQAIHQYTISLPAGLNIIGAAYFGNFGPSRADLNGLEYIASHADLIDAFGPNDQAGTAHYVSIGFQEGRTLDSFDAAQYLANYADLRAAFGSDQNAATIHYITHGFREGRVDDPIPVSARDFELAAAANGAAGSSIGDLLVVSGDAATGTASSDVDFW
jgi:hypothetical protein